MPCTVARVVSLTILSAIFVLCDWHYFVFGLIPFFPFTAITVMANVTLPAGPLGSNALTS